MLHAMLHVTLHAMLHARLQARLHARLQASLGEAERRERLFGVEVVRRGAAQHARLRVAS